MWICGVETIVGESGYFKKCCSSIFTAFENEEIFVGSLFPLHWAEFLRLSSEDHKLLYI